MQSWEIGQKGIRCRACCGRRLVAVPRVPVPIDVRFVRTGEMDARRIIVGPGAVLGLEHVGPPLRDLRAVLVLLNDALPILTVPAIPV